jgi:hypothetical protein
MLVVVSVIFEIGVAAMIWLSTVAVLITVAVLPFGVDVMREISVTRTVLTLDTVLGVLVSTTVSEKMTVEYFVTGDGVTRVYAVIFEVSNFVDVVAGP